MLDKEPHPCAGVFPSGHYANRVVLPPDHRIGIRQAGTEFFIEAGQRTAMVTFEVFSYPANNGGIDTPIITLSQVVPFKSKDAECRLPDYDSMVQEAASILEANLKLMTEVLGRTARFST